MSLTRRSTVRILVVVASLVASLAALAGCNDATGPDLANRVFSAVSVEGAALPVTLTASGTAEHRLLSDVLAFLADGNARRTIRTSVLDRRTSIEQIETHERLTPYRVKGGRVILAQVCPMSPASSVSCIAPDTAFFDGPNLLLRTQTFERRRVLLVPVETPTLHE